MANFSDAYGTVTLSGEWTPAMCKNLNALKKDWATWEYSLTIDEDFSPSSRSLVFSGIGRWSFISNLKSLDRWCYEEFILKPSLGIAYLALTKEMKRNNSKIEFTFTDEEAGFLFISTDSVTFAANDGHLFIKKSTEVPHEYTWENYLAFDFGGEEQLAELVDDLLKMLNLDEDGRSSCRDRIEEWAKANTLPHAYAKSMSEETTTKFKAAFSDLDTNHTK